jgi:YidC/Oxa1 family membrane protein insertase
MSFIWHTFFFDPIYNGLVFFIDTIPGGDVGLAIIAITLVVKLILLPLSAKAARMQRVMREIEPKMVEIKEKHKNNREELARATMAAYKEAGINPFSGIFLMFIQIPIVIALYFSVYSGGGVSLPNINVDLLYSFIPSPETIDMIFLGVVDIAAKSLPLAFLAGLTQFIHAHFSLPKPEPRKEGVADMKADFMRSMNMNMRYVLPVIIGFVAYTLSASVALYFTVSNLFAIAQEFFLRPRKQS